MALANQLQGTFYSSVLLSKYFFVFSFTMMVASNMLSLWLLNIKVPIFLMFFAHIAMLQIVYYRAKYFLVMIIVSIYLATRWVISSLSRTCWNVAQVNLLTLFMFIFLSPSAAIIVVWVFFCLDLMVASPYNFRCLCCFLLRAFNPWKTWLWDFSTI